MTTFHGLIQRNIVNAGLQFEKLGYITNNVSNQNTTAYKSLTFEQIMSEDGYLKGVVKRDFRPNHLIITDNKFDMGIEGQGFFPVTSPDGDVKYTRDGSMKQNKDGYLITQDGYLVGDGIKLPINYDDWWIKSNGDVVVTKTFGAKPEKIGTIPIVNFQNPDGLKAVDGNKFIPTEDSGEPVLIVNHDKIQQQKLESANVDMITDSTRVMRLNASMLASFQVVKTINDLYQKCISLQG